MAHDGNTKTIVLGAVLTETQINNVTRLINQIREGKRNSHDLRIYLESASVSKHLLGQDILPAYLYYMLCHQFNLL